jgi:hypothetical protein
MHRLGYGLTTSTALVIAMLLGGSAPAGADVWTRTDAVGDVWVPTGVDRFERVTVVRPNTDVRRFVVNHGTDTIVVKVRYLDLRNTDDQELDVSMELKTSTQFWSLSGIFGGGDPGVFVVVGDSNTGERVECGASGRVSYRKDLVKLVVPRSCIGEPEWLQVRGFHRWYTESLGVRYDDLLTRRGRNWTWSHRIFR